MKTLKVFKKIESDRIQIKELKDFIGSNAEIIILIEDEDQITSDTSWSEALSVIENFNGSVLPWSRDELYDR